MRGSSSYHTKLYALMAAPSSRAPKNLHHRITSHLEKPGGPKRSPAGENTDAWCATASRWMLRWCAGSERAEELKSPRYSRTA